MPNVRAHRVEINAALRRHRAVRARIFGSVARGQAGADSDVDLLVQFEQGSSLFDLMALQDELEQLLGAPVDIVSEGGLKERDTAIRAEAVDL